MRVLIILLALAAALLTLALDGCTARDDLAEARRWDAYRREQEFRERYGAALDAAALILAVAPAAGVVILALVALDAYAQRRRPLVRLDADGLTVERERLRDAHGEMLLIQRDLAALREQVRALAALHQPPHTLSIRVDSSASPASPASPAPDAAHPVAPPLRDLVAAGYRPTVRRVILGCDGSGPVYAPLTGLLSTAVAGRPGQGKSTLLRLVAYQTIGAGGTVYILDPHGSVAEDVAGAPTAATAATAAELTDLAGMLLDELDRRLMRYRAGRREFAPALALVDELPAVALASRRAMDAAGRIILEGRKVQMFAFVSGQGLPAQQFGGRLVRDALSSRYVFRTSPDEARRCGLPADAARRVVDLRPGLAMVDAGVLSAPTVLAIPLCTPDDLRTLGSGREADGKRAEAGGSGAHDPPAAPEADGKRAEAGGSGAHDPPAAPEADGKRAEAGGSGGREPPAAPAEADGKRAEAADARAERVRAMVRAGASQNDIIRELWGATGGRRYQEAAEELRAILARLV